MPERRPVDDEPTPGMASAEADSPLQQYGYVRSYRAIAQSCGLAEAYLYGVLEDYVQLGARTKRDTIPSHTHLAELMHCSTRSITTYLNRLREKGWIRWESTNGKPSRYFLPNRRRNCGGGTQNLQTTSANFADNQEQRARTKSKHPPTPQGERLEFQAFWADVIRREPSEEKALEAWLKARKKASAEEIHAGLRRWLPAWQGLEDRAKIPHITTWLNQSRWTVQEPVIPTTLNGRYATASEMNAGGTGKLVS